MIVEGPWQGITQSIPLAESLPIHTAAVHFLHGFHLLTHLKPIFKFNHLQLGQILS